MKFYGATNGTCLIFLNFTGLNTILSIMMEFLIEEFRIIINNNMWHKLNLIFQTLMFLTLV